MQQDAPSISSAGETDDAIREASDRFEEELDDSLVLMLDNFDWCSRGVRDDALSTSGYKRCNVVSIESFCDEERRSDVWTKKSSWRTMSSESELDVTLVSIRRAVSE